jgi:hypothetical protein
VTLPTVTVGTLLDLTREELVGDARAEFNLLGAAISSPITYPTTAAITISNALGGITPGAYLGIDDELFYVWSTSGNTATVTGGWFTTTATTHTAGSVVEVNPWFPRHRIRVNMQDEIRSWGPQVFAVKTTDISAVAGQRGYDLGAISPFYFVLRAQLDTTPLPGESSDESWPDVAFYVLQQAPTSDFPSGNALVLGVDIWNQPLFQVSTIHVTYAAPFDVDTSFSDTTDIVNTVGIDPSDLDIVRLGVRWRMLSAREVRRGLTESQAEPRTATEVPPMYLSQAAEAAKKLRDSRLADAQARLYAQYPRRR